jgi:hypothetical protein
MNFSQTEINNYKIIFSKQIKQLDLLIAIIFNQNDTKINLFTATAFTLSGMGLPE